MKIDDFSRWVRERQDEVERALERWVPEDTPAANIIEAVVAGQGIAICSDVLVAPELASGALLQVASITLPGYGFYIVHRKGHPKRSSIKAFVAWMMSAR